MLFGQNYYNIQRFSETGNVRACKVLLLNVLPDYKRIKLPSSFNEILILAEFMNVFINSKFQNASYLMLVFPYYHKYFIYCRDSAVSIAATYGAAGYGIGS